MTPLDQNKLGEWLSAYLDGELDAEQSRAVEAWLGEDESARRMLGGLQRTVELVRTLPRRSAPATIADDLQFHLERSELLDAPADPTRRPGSRIAVFGRWCSAAAMLALVVLGGWWVMHDMTGRDSSMMAKREKLTAAKELQASRTLLQETAASKTFEALATFEQKLAMGLDEAALRRHHFANESIHLTLASRDAGRRDGLVADILRDLRGSKVSDLGTVTSETRSPDGAKSGVYFEGKAGVNFAGKGKRVVLVRASGKQLERVLKRLGRTSASLTGVSLAVDSARFQGSQRVRGMLAHLVGAERETDSSPSSFESTASASRTGSIDSAPRTDRSAGSTDPKADTTEVRAPLPSIEDFLRHLGFHSAAPIGSPSKAKVRVADAGPASAQESKTDTAVAAADADAPPPGYAFEEGKGGGLTADATDKPSARSAGGSSLKNERGETATEEKDAVVYGGSRGKSKTSESSPTGAKRIDPVRDPIETKSAERQARSPDSTMAGRRSLVDRRMVELERARNQDRRASGSASRKSSDASEPASSRLKKTARRNRRRSSPPSGQPDRSIPTGPVAPSVARPITIVIEFTAKEPKPVKRQPNPPPPNRRSQNRSRTGPSAQAR